MKKLALISLLLSPVLSFAGDKSEISTNANTWFATWGIWTLIILLSSGIALVIGGFVYYGRVKKGKSSSATGCGCFTTCVMFVVAAAAITTILYLVRVPVVVQTKERVFENESKSSDGGQKGSESEASSDSSPQGAAKTNDKAGDKGASKAGEDDF